MVKYKTTLKAEDLKFFYEVLYQYEKEGENGHKGYSYNEVFPDIRDKVALIHDTPKGKIEFAFPTKRINCVIRELESLKNCLVFYDTALHMLV